MAVILIFQMKHTGILSKGKQPKIEMGTQKNDVDYSWLPEGTISDMSKCTVILLKFLSREVWADSVDWYGAAWSGSGLFAFVPWPFGHVTPFKTIVQVLGYLKQFFRVYKSFVFYFKIVFCWFCCAVAHAVEPRNGVLKQYILDQPRQLSRVSFWGKGGHRFDPGPRHTIVTNVTSCSQYQDNVTVGIMSSVWGMILQWGSTWALSSLSQRDTIVIRLKNCWVTLNLTIYIGCWCVLKI